MPREPAALVARTRPLDRDVDLLAVAGGEGVLFDQQGAGLAGQGVALRVPLGGVTETLGAIKADDPVGRPGCGPVAFGALPFTPGDERYEELVVPDVVVGKAPDGTRWLTTVGPLDADHPSPDLDRSADAHPGPAEEPSRFDVAATRSPDQWCDAVAEAVARIEAGELEKVVLARELLVTADRPIPVAKVLSRLRASYPDSFVYSFAGFVGAMPELLVSRQGDVVRSHPFAGTAPRRGDPRADAQLAAALLSSPVYRYEHQVTIETVHDTLLPFCSWLDYEPEPQVVPLANVQHLASRVEGRLSHPPASVLELREVLHPTPAVCGRPREAARSLIAELEGFDRGRYAGTVGWVDADGNGTWAVSLRCAQIDGARARLAAGNGIVAGSDPVVELEETRAKLHAMLSALIRP